MRSHTIEFEHVCCVVEGREWASMCIAGGTAVEIVLVVDNCHPARELAIKPPTCMHFG